MAYWSSGPPGKTTLASTTVPLMVFEVACVNDAGQVDDHPLVFPGSWT
jgi:hypothetical protein